MWSKGLCPAQFVRDANYSASHQDKKYNNYVNVSEYVVCPAVAETRRPATKK